MTKRSLFQKPLLFCHPEKPFFLKEAFAAQNTTPLYFPLFDIAPLSALSDKAVLEDTLSRLSDVSIALFVSPNAAKFALSSFFAAPHRTWPQTTQAMSVGKSTANAIAAFGISPVFYPETGEDSEALLLHPRLNSEAIFGQKIVIFRAQTGRSFLSDTLQTRGAHPHFCKAYERQHRSLDALPHCLTQNEPDALFFFTSEDARRVTDFLKTMSLWARAKNLPFLSPFARVRGEGKALGWSWVLECPAEDFSSESFNNPPPLAQRYLHKFLSTHFDTDF